MDTATPAPTRKTVIRITLAWMTAGFISLIALNAANDHIVPLQTTIAIWITVSWIALIITLDVLIDARQTDQSKRFLDPMIYLFLTLIMLALAAELGQISSQTAWRIGIPATLIGIVWSILLLMRYNFRFDKKG